MGIFRKGGATAEGKKGKTTESVQNPYTDTRVSWDDRNAGLEAQNHMLRLWLILTGLTLLVAVTFVGIIGTRSKVIPYVVEVDKLGDALAIDPAARAISAMDPRIVRATLTTWITDTRGVTPDLYLEHRNMFYAYAYVKPQTPAYQELTQWFTGTPGEDPISRSKKELVNVTVGTIIEMSADSWQVDWREDTRLPDGRLVRKEHYRGVFTLQVGSPGPETERHIRLNPLNLYIKNFHWVKLNA